jgi:hypothetical protein
MQVPGIGCFVRALLRVRLTGGHALTYGVWLGVDPRLFSSIFEAWWEPSYADLQISGRLANAIEPHGVLGAPVEARVRHVDEAPYCERSSDPSLDRLLRDEWPHEIALSTDE